MNELSRRQLLSAFLGAPLLYAGCSSRRGSRSLSDIDGELALRRDKLGHRLRDLESLPRPTKWLECEVAVVGGGVAGLACMRALEAQGIDKTLLLELDEAVGGTARGGRQAVSAHPWGAHYVTVPMRENTELIALLSEVGAVERITAEGQPVMAEQHLCRDPSERIFYRGRWYEGLYPSAGASAADIEQRARFDSEVDGWVRFRDQQGRRAFSLPMSTSSDDERVRALDRQSMAQWMDERELHSPRLRWWVEYACRDDYGTTLADTSAWAALFYYASRKRSPGSDFQEVITWPEGNAHLVEHMHRGVAERVRTGHAIASVDSQEEGVELVALNEQGSVGIRARYAVMATPQFINARVVRGLQGARLEAAQSAQQSPWMVANLVVNARPAGNGFPLCWDNVLYESPSLGYVVATHQKGPERGPSLLTYYYPLTDSDPRVGRRRLLELGWKEWAEVVLSDLERAHPGLRNHVTRLDVGRWGHGMVRSSPGRIWDGKRELSAQAHGRVHFAHSDLSGVALFEEAFDRGTGAGRRVAALMREEHRPTELIAP